MSQNCVWNVPQCSGRMERRGCITGLVPDLWSVMKYYTKVNMYIIYIYIYICMPDTVNLSYTSQGYAC